LKHEEVQSFFFSMPQLPEEIRCIQPKAMASMAMFPEADFSSRGAAGTSF
jgi:hypothetical protein